MSELSPAVTDEAVAKKKLWIFIACAYGIPAIITIFMIIGRKMETDLSAIVSAQMMTPALGVIMGKLICRKKDEKMQVGTYILYVVLTALMLIGGMIVALVPAKTVTISGQSMSMGALICQLPLIILSPVITAFFLLGKKEQREESGLGWKNTGMSIFMIALFLVLYFVRAFGTTIISDLISGTSTLGDQLKGLVTLQAIISLVSVGMSLPLSCIAFFGEEYGWRYYLQPIMLDKFGKRKGILLLGLVWAFWHINICYFYYSPQTGTMMFLAQIITCVSIAIFFGYGYIKSKNMWVPILMHFFNNNLIPFLNGGDASVIEDQTVTAHDILVHLIISLIFAAFIFSPVFSDKKKEV